MIFVARRWLHPAPQISNFGATFSGRYVEAPPGSTILHPAPQIWLQNWSARLLVSTLDFLKSIYPNAILGRRTRIFWRKIQRRDEFKKLGPGPKILGGPHTPYRCV